MGRGLVQHEDVQIAVAIEVGDKHLTAGAADEALLFGQGSKRAIAIVVDEFVAGGAR